MAGNEKRLIKALLLAAAITVAANGIALAGGSDKNKNDIKCFRVATQKWIGEAKLPKGNTIQSYGAQACMNKYPAACDSGCLGCKKMRGGMVCATPEGQLIPIAD